MMMANESDVEDHSVIYTDYLSNNGQCMRNVDLVPVLVQLLQGQSRWYEHGLSEWKSSVK